MHKFYKITKPYFMNSKVLKFHQTKIETNGKIATQLDLLSFFVKDLPNRIKIFEHAKLDYL